MPSISTPNEKEERLSVLVGNADDAKLLGVPGYKPGTDWKSGDIISELSLDLLRSWKCYDNITNMVFDTTASNTGHLTAACIAIQNSLGKALLWSGCRHHVGEVILTQVFKDLRIQASKSPDITVFMRFRSNFNLVPQNSNQPLAPLDLSEFSETKQTLLQQFKDDAENVLRSKVDLVRDDYREFTELCMFFLGFQTSITFKQPGALHKARWMAKLIYSIKISLMQDHIQQLPQGTITTKHQLPKIREFVTFATTVYSPWWLTCSIAVDAPWNDLNTSSCYCTPMWILVFLQALSKPWSVICGISQRKWSHLHSSVRRCRQQRNKLWLLNS